MSTREKIYHFIEEYYIEHLNFPNYREIAKGVDLKSISSVFEHMVKMVDLGQIIYEGKQYRFNREIMLEIFKKIIGKGEFKAKMSQARELYPFKINGDFETYNSYNEGWQDALNFVESEVNGEL